MTLTVSEGLAALHITAPLETRSASMELAPIPPLPENHGVECQTAWHQGYLEGIGAALKYLGDDDDDEPDERNYSYTDGLGINDGDDSISDIGEQPCGLGRYCELCGEFECDCDDAIGGEVPWDEPAVPYTTPFVQCW